MKSVIPTKILMPFMGRVKISLFGQPIDWSTNPLYGPRPWDTFVCRNMSTVATNDGINRLYLPRAGCFNAKICGPTSWPDRVQAVNHEDENHPDNRETTPEIFYGMEAEAVEMPMGTSDGFWLPSADCVCVIVYHEQTGRMICFHAGFRSLWDSENIISGKIRRKYASVVDAVADRLGPEKMKDSFFFMTLSIGAGFFKKPWDDPECGEENRISVEHIAERWGTECIIGNIKEGGLDLRKIIRRQLRKYGVSEEKIGEDGNDTYSARDGDSRYLWWSYEREKRSNSKLELCRNGVMIRRVRRLL